MEYTVNKLGSMAGISTRTLRYYDEIDILKPARINSSGYRIYGQKEVDRLQQILFYRELGFGLDRIGEIIDSPDFDGLKALSEHHDKLLEKREQLDLLIANVEKSIASAKGGSRMRDQDKFEGFKKRLIEENEQKYGKEIREKYGKETVEQSNRKVMNMTKQQYDEVNELANQVKTTLAEAFKTGDPSGDIAQKAVELHRQWLSYFWDGYTKEAHAGLGQMYVEDQRFKAFYDQEQPGTAEFFRDAIKIYTRAE